MTLQHPMFKPKIEWAPPTMASMPSWAGAGRVSIDLETRDEKLSSLGPGVRRGAYIVGIGFAIEDGPAHYLPIRHLEGDNLPDGQVISYFKNQAKVFTGDLAGTNLQYDLDYLLQEGIEFKPRFFRDVQIAEPILDELQDSYSLDSIAGRYDLPGKEMRTISDAASAYGFVGSEFWRNLWKLPARYVADYCVQDARLPLTILRKQESKIDEEELWEIYNLESKLMPVLLRMKRRGIRFSPDRLERVEKWSLEEETKALETVRAETGVRIQPGECMKAELLARALKTIGVEAPLTEKTRKPSIDKEFLASVDHPVARALERARRVNKVRSTFVESIRTHAIGDRVHCGFNQLRREKDEKESYGEGALAGAAYGRISSEHPNMQQQPARDPEIGPLWRSIYVPEDGESWAVLDFSQQEPRILTHGAELAGCVGAYEAAERYRKDPSTDNHAMLRDMLRWEGKTGRDRAKNIFLGLCYGMGEAKLCRQVDLPTKWEYSSKYKRTIEVAGPEGKALLDEFNRLVPYPRQLARIIQRLADQRGFIRTLGGRRCRFPRKQDGTFDWTHKALNRWVQGSSADQVKISMVRADEAGYQLRLQVHDELDLSAPCRESVEGLAEIMRSSLDLNVPSKVDIEVGPSWGECK